MTAMQTEALMDEAAKLLEEARRERDAARQEAADLRAALAEAQAPTCAELLRRLNLSGEDKGSRLVVMAQNPGDSHNWSRAVGRFTAGEVRAALRSDPA